MKSHGFTLLELLICITIISILLLTAAPGFSSLTTRNEADAIAADVYKTLQYARSKAQHHNQTYSLCGSNDGMTCSRDWESELIVFDDANGNDLIEPEEKIFTQSVSSNKVRLQTRLGFGLTTAQFDNLGRAPITGSILVCEKSLGAEATPSRKITWNGVGRPYLLESQSAVEKKSSMKCS